ncbi:siderophore-interacting protein [Candidatus Symbiopectobacterium sp. NZEC151]|uniref:siderophore-interacting protein n=1 Tax=Candidatus Symbiopectobacterium sp. NZEC151 TaxID=2820470 RepID=UPI0022279603|nr:siderophore-interacting protein [Candidatus Symbiopectobacterium sp. NZEC151]MCW2476249.1 siderophore-interacting protein [Candidatus Symbiopectobacterium sp. NZEC151]
MAEKQRYRIFNVVLARKVYLTPSLMRCVFSGESVRQMKMDAPDQRIKLLLPPAEGVYPDLPDSDDWYRQWLALPKAQRPVMRTYTLREVDAANGEMAVEFVVHGTEGPASAWAIQAQAGDALRIVAPCVGDYEGDSGGYEWLPPAEMTHALLIGDETALPAIKGILEQLAQYATPVQVQAFIEVPLEADCVDMSAFAFAEVHWLPRKPQGACYGERLLHSVRAHVRLPERRPEAETTELHEVAEGELLWESASQTHGQFFGWVAAESSVVKNLRRYLSGERQVPRDIITFMAYWSRERQRDV